MAEAPIEDASITWSSSDETILTVSATGMVQSSGPEGLVTIKATYLSFSDSAFVYVGTPPAGEVLSTLTVEEAWRVAVTPGGRYLVTTISDELLSGTLPSFALTGSIPMTGTAVGLTINQAADRAYVVRGTTDEGGDGVDVVDLATNEVIDVLTVPLRQSHGGGAVAGREHADRRHACHDREGGHRRRVVRLGRGWTRWSSSCDTRRSR